MREMIDQPRADMDIIEQGGKVPAPSSNRSWPLLPHGSIFKVKNTRKRLWTLRLRRAAEVYVLGGPV